MDGKAICDKFDSLKILRSNYEQTWSDIARFLRPIGKGFSSQQTEGQRKHTGIFDSSPIMALENFKGGLYSAVTPPGSMWFELQHIDDDMNEYGPVKDYLAIVNKRTWRSFGPGVSAFYNQVTSVWGDLGAFGTGVLYSNELFGKQRFIDRARALHECWLDVDESDIVDTLYRRYELTARAIAGKGGEGTPPDERWNVPQKLITEAEKSPSSKHWVIHAVYPDPKPGENYGKRFKECYVLEEGKHILRESGYFEFPYMSPRWDVAAGERYGTGCGHAALADIKSLNIARRSNLNMMDRAARPTILTSKENDIGGGIAPYPGEIVYGAISSDGKKLVSPMDEGKNAQIAIEMEERIANAIKDAFYFGLMQIVGSRDMTATEFLGRDDERQRLLGPYLGRIETEFLSPVVLRRVGMLERSGGLPEMPDVLKDYPGGLQVRYVSPLARLQRQGEAESANKVLMSLLNIAQARPDIMDRIDVDTTAEIIADGFGSRGVLNSRDVAQQMRDAREQQQQAMAMAQAAPGVARAAKDGVDAANAALDPRLMGLRQEANAA
jgi:hypothetical protein